MHPQVYTSHPLNLECSQYCSMGKKGKGSYPISIHVDLGEFIYDYENQNVTSEVTNVHLDDGNSVISKKAHRAIVRNANICLCDHMNELQSLPKVTQQRCWFCRLPFTSSPLGIPLQYKYILPGDPIYKMLLQTLRENNYQVEDGEPMEYFITEGNLCSFSCLKSQINDELAKSNMSARYMRAMENTRLLKLKMYNIDSHTQFANSWKLNKEYGGVLDPSECKDLINDLYYRDSINRKFPLLYAAGTFVVVE